MSYNFDGVDDLVSFESSPPSFPTAFTIVAWIKPDSFSSSSRSTVFTSYDSSNGNGIGLFATPAGSTGSLKLEATFSGGLARWQSPNDDLTAGQWYGVAATLDASSTANDPMLYRKVGSDAISSRTVTELLSPSGSVLTGYDGWWSGGVFTSYAFDGRIAYVRLFNRVLTQTEVDSELTTPGSVTSGCLVAWDFQSDANDSSGNSRNGTVSGATLDSDNPPLGTGVTTLFQRRMRRFFVGV
jgi:hypothetical protein